MEEKSKKPFVSEKNRLSRFLLAHEHINVSIDEWKCVALNPIEKLWDELNSLTKDRRSKNENEHFEVLKNGLYASNHQRILASVH